MNAIAPLNPRYNQHPEALTQFNEDVAGHQMIVKLDQGLYRHLVFVGSSWEHRFEVITTPGQLTITGDMGSYVFAREDDMINNFFSKSNSPKPRYWEEKLEATDKVTPRHQLSPNKFRETILKGFWDMRSQLSRKDTKALWENVHEHFFDTEYPTTTIEQANHLFATYPHTDGFDHWYDVEPSDYSEYSTHYLWICHAVLWSTQHYARVNREVISAGASSGSLLH